MARADVSERNRIFWTGRKHRPESIEKMRQARKGKSRGPRSQAWTPELREQVRRKLLGRKHSAASRKKMSEARKGVPLSMKNRLGIKRALNSPKIKAKVRKGLLRHAALGSSGCGCYVHGPKSPTSLERKLLRLLREFPIVEDQKWFGRYRVDAYLPPPYHLAFEADGAYWHQRKTGKDAARDLFLLEKFGLPIVRLTEEDLCGAF